MKDFKGYDQGAKTDIRKSQAVLSLIMMGSRRARCSSALSS